MNAAAKDIHHAVNDPAADFGMRIYERKGLKLMFPNAQSCIACHNPDSLPDTLAARLKEHERNLLQLFPPETVHSRLSDGLIAYPPVPLDFTRGKEEFSHVAGQTVDYGVIFRLQGLTDPSLRGYVEPHELAHYLTQVPGDYLAETWAYAAGTLTTPLKILKEADSKNDAPKFVAILHRAALFNGQRAGRLPSAQSASEAQTVLQGMTDQQTSRDLEAFRPLFRKAFSEYRKNNAFWDAAAYKFQNPYLVFDVFLARHLHEQKDPNLHAVLSRPDELAGILRNLVRTGEARQKEWASVYRELPEVEAHARRVMMMDETSSDIRNALGAHYPPDHTQAELDGKYFAGIHALFCNADGSLRYEALTRKELAEHAQKKMGLVQLSLESLAKTRGYLKSQVGGSEEDKRRMSGRMDQWERLHERTLSGLKKMVSTGRFARP